jgi:hypothetical protein
MRAGRPDDRESLAPTYFFFFSGSGAGCGAFETGATFSWSCAIAGRVAVCIALGRVSTRITPGRHYSLPRMRREETP